jgi:hypothetical protein
VCSPGWKTEGGGRNPKSTVAAELGRLGLQVRRCFGAKQGGGALRKRARACARGGSTAALKGHRRGGPGRSRPNEQTSGGAASGCPVRLSRAPDGPR